MEKNRKIIIFPVIIVLISLIMIIFSFVDKSENNINTIIPQTNEIISGIPTDPIEFTNEYYRGKIGQYTTTDPLALGEKADYIIKGTLVEVLYTEQLLNDNDPIVMLESGDHTDVGSITFFTIQIDEILKGTINEREFTIRSVLPSKIKYERDNTILVMFDEKNDTFVLNGGPYSMFKLENELAIGHEKTYSQEKLLDLLK